MVAIGIDLGTTNSCVAVWRRGRVEIIANDLGDRITPSCVAFDEEERFIGKPAVLQTTKNPRNTVYEVKRLIGRNFNDPLVQGDMKNWPFLVVDVEGSPRIQVEYLLESKVLAPEEISAMVLGKLKDTAEKFLDCEVTDAVITVPAYFTNAQREATIDAGKIAGLNVLRIINEPTAAALAYGLNTTQEEKRTVLIYDLGGGTFDVSIVRIEHGPKIEVLATNGDTHLGGSDFDNLIVEHLAVIFQDESGKDVRENAKSRYKLRREVEAAKVLLSTNYQANIYIDALMDGADFDHTITLATFEELCSTLIRSTIVHVENAMKDAKLLKSGIDEVVLVGGSTRIPMVRQLLREFFAGKALKEDINCDEAVAYGAAVQAAILSGEAGVDFQDLTFTDVTPMSLGTEVYGGYMDVVVPKNTRIPCSVSKKYCTVSDNQTRMESRVFEGEKKMVRDNNFLGNYIMTGIPPAKANVGCTLDTFHINENNILTVTSVEQITRKKESITIRMEKRRLPVKERERMTEDAETYRREDQRNNERDEAEHLLESMTLRERD